MHRRPPVLIVLVTVLLTGTVLALEAHAADTAASSPFALRDGDRVVFYGDSITQEGGYGRLVEVFVATRFPTWDVRFYNSGVGGDRVSGGWAGSIEQRLDRDVVAHRPTVVTIMLGMNDGGYKPYDPATFAAYASGYRRIVRTLKTALPDVRLTLIQPSPFDDVARPPQFPGGYDDVLRRYGCYVEELARREGVRAVDFRGPVNAGVAAVMATHPELARQILPDRVHPSDSGHLVMGAALLRAWNAPSLVTRVEIDAEAPRLVAAERTTVSGLGGGDDGVSWTQQDEALPLPLRFQDATVELAEAAGAGLEALDQQPLVVTGLAPGRYELRVDDETIGTFSTEELARGLNLATLDTPMRRQAFTARWAAASRHELRRVHRQLVAGDTADSRWLETAAALESFDEATQAARTGATKPIPRRYRVTRR